MIEKSTVFNNLRGSNGNLIINGGFDWWQHLTTYGTVTNSATGYICDHWRLTNSADGGTLPTTIIISQQQDYTQLNAYNHIRINPNGAGSGFGANAEYFLEQPIENAIRYFAGAGRPITVSFYAKSSIANKKVGIYLVENYGTGGSPTSAETINGTYFTLTSSWTKYTYTFTLNTVSGKTFGTDLLDFISLRIGVLWGSTSKTKYGDTNSETFVDSGDIDIGRVTVASGYEEIEYWTMNRAEELLKCQRYFEKSYDTTTPAGTATVLGAYVGASSAGVTTLGGRIFETVVFKATKAKSPTMQGYSTTTGTGGKFRDYTAAADFNSAFREVNTQKVGLDSSGQTAGNWCAGHWTAVAELI